MMTVEIRINGELTGKLAFVNTDSLTGNKFLYRVSAEQYDPSGKPFVWGPKHVKHVREHGMMQLLSNGLAVLGWKPKPWSVPE